MNLNDIGIFFKNNLLQKKRKVDGAGEEMFTKLNPLKFIRTRYESLYYKHLPDFTRKLL